MELNKARFYKAAYDTTLEDHERFNIGTYKEKKLHKILKLYLEPETAYHEISFAGFIADIKTDAGIIEIETSGFTGLREKLDAYLPTCSVTLVYPVTSRRIISWIEPSTGEIISNRQSPKKENIYDLLFECIYIADYLTHPNLHILGICLEMQEYRMLDGWSRDKKKGSHRYERIPTDILEILELDSPASFAECIPEECKTDFTAAQFCKAIRKNEYTGRAILKVLQKVGVIEQNGKKGRCLLYSRSTCNPAAEKTCAEQRTQEV